MFLARSFTPYTDIVDLGDRLGSTAMSSYTTPMTTNKKPKTRITDGRHFYLFHVLAVWMIVVLIFQIMHHDIKWYSIVVACFIALMEFNYVMYRRKGYIKTKRVKP
jgi:hypothetical protein